VETCHEEEPVTIRFIDTGLARVVPTTLTAVITRRDHAELRAIEARLRRAGVPIEKVVAILHRHATRQHGARRDAPWRDRQARPQRAALVRSPIEKHARALRAYLEDVDRLVRGEPVPGGVRVDFADPFVPPLKAHRGPRRWSARDQLDALGVSRRDRAWLLQRATGPTQ
jgi:hypothetical protein